MKVDSLPHWIQIPWVMFLLMLFGASFGFQFGVLWEGYLRKWVTWLCCDRKRVKK